MGVSKIPAVCVTTDYHKANDYDIRICQVGKLVTVSGIIYGTGESGYVGVNLPRFFFNSSQPQSNALVFIARNQSTGAYKTLRCGGSFLIYRESDMTVGVRYAFAFSYCAD